MSRVDELIQRTLDMQARGLIPPDPVGLDAPPQPILGVSPCGKSSPPVGNHPDSLEPAPCGYEGEYLTGLQRRELNLYHGRNWRRCLHPDKPLGTENVCSCLKPIGCGVSCPGYEVANECPTKKPHPFKPIKWAYGITTVPSRRDCLLPRTLLSLREGGFDTPRLFVDGEQDAESWKDEFKLEVTCRYPTMRTHGNWILSLYELFIREPVADRYALFQDDMVTSKGLREYLDHTSYPEKGYWNLYTFPENQELCPPNYTGWYRSNQYGRGAVALIFNRDALLTLLQSQHMMERPMNADRGWKAVDGGIVTAMNKAGYAEFVHNPSLVQHIGEKSSMGSKVHPLAISFKGEGFDFKSLIPSQKGG